MPTRKAALGDDPWDDLVPTAQAAPANDLTPPIDAVAPKEPSVKTKERQKRPSEKPAPPSETDKLHRAGVYLHSAHVGWLEDVRTRAMVEKRGDIAVSKIVRAALEELERLPWDKLMARLGRDS